jgi:amino acid adenylation domain-containing protein
MLAQQANLADFFLSTGNATSIAANRISYQFGFRGPSLAMDTACSSSLVAIHHACKSLRLGESSLAVVGGANLILSPLVTSLLAQGKMLSPDGQCRVFDKDANGYVRGEGVGVVVLKRLTHALRDGDPVYCVIKGTAIGHDGQANGLTAPNPAAQRAVIQAALADGSLDVSQVDYVEAHGTGTPLGDPIEARVIGDTLSGQLHRSVPLRIGSVKANIGHLEAAAGIAGLIKVALMLEHHQIVPSLNWRVPNPLIPFDELSLQVATAHEAWPSKSHGLPVAGISSFGFGGTNAHAVLEAIDASSARGNRPRRSAPAWDRECYWFDESLTSSRPRLGNAPPTPAPDRDLQSIALDALAEILVTPRELIDPDTPLPELGVDSIMAMELLDELRELTSADIPLASLVDAPSLNQLLERIASNHSAFSRPAATPSNTRPLSPSTPARWAVNPIQRELWTLGVVADAPAIWNLAVRLDCVGTLDLRLLQQALQQVVQRHEALRSTIEMDDHQLLQIVHQHAPVAVRHIDLALFDSSKQDEIIDRELLDLAQTPIDTQRAPLLRAVHIQTTTQHAVVGIAVSHLVCDGWSMRLLHRELWQAYEALSRRDRTIWSTPAPTFLRSGHPPQLSTIEPSQDDARNSPANTIAANNPIVPMTLPYDLTASTMPRYRGERVPFALDAELSSRVLDFSRIHGVTPFVTLLTGLATVVARYNAGAPVVLHVAVAGRETVDQLHTVGPLFQIIPVHLALDLSSNLVALAHQLRDRLRAAQHESTFNVAAVGSTQRSLARQQQRIRILVDYQDQGEIGQEIAGLKVASVELDNGTAMAELAVCLRRHLDQFVGHLQFDTSLYTRQTIESFLAHFTTLLRHMLSDLSIPATRADLLSHDERHMLLNDLNATAVRYDSHALVDQVIAESANKMPENVALVCEHALGTTTRLTYASLVQQAKIIAHVLRSKHQVGRGDRVAVLLPRDITLVPALLGVLRTGAAYVPVDTSYPLARQQAIMQNADARCAITCGEFTTCIPSTIPQVDLDQYHDELRCGREPMLLQSFATSHVSQPDELRSADDPAYILYTSGSTGTPKGVVVSHRNVHNFFVAMDQLQPDSAPGVWLATTSIGFDISVFELLWTVARGYQVVLHPSGMLASAAREQGHMRDRSIASTIVRNRITHLQCTPALAKILIDDPEAATALRNLKRLFVGGDVLPLPLANRLCELVGGKVYNMYGPTETTVWSTAQQLTPGADRVSIGRPLANTQLLVLDHNLSPVPTNIPGELYIAGDGVSSGYFNDPSRTAERFLSPQDCLTHGSATEPPLSSSHRLFRTGDRVKYTSTGELLFLGRIDTQTKIQGHRIELPEIELALAAHPDVQQAVVVAVTNDHHELELRSYLIPQTGAMLDPAELRRFLQLRLPLGVVPSQFIIVSQFPLTPNGKVDRLALSQLNSPPETSRSLSTNSRLSHETQSQPGVGAAPKIRSLIADELHLAEIPETTDIQQLGLTSLEVLRIANRIETTFGSRPPMIRFFEGGSIEHLVMEHLSTLSSNSPLASDPPSVQPVADAPMVGTAVMDHPPSDSVLDRLARRRRSTPNDESQNAKSSQRQLRTGETFARFVEPVKAELLSRVGLDIAYVRGEGCYVWDEHGRRYLDFIAQYGALPFGYNPPRIWAALQDVEQNQRPSIATNSLLPTAGDLAAALLAVSPPTLSHVTFCNSGAEAAEVAIKLARAATNRPGILSTQRSFHGLTLGALAATGEPDFRRPFHVDGDHFTQVPYGDLDAIGRVLSRHPNHFAAMMIEPLQGEGGIIEPPEGYLSQLHELCKRYGVLLICDEVQTGLGRTGSLFACEQQNVAPDILMLAKALGGGLMPIGAVLSNDRAYSDRFGLRHSSTFAGNALACSAGLASLRHLLENDRALVRHVHETGSVLQTQLRELASRYPELIADTRGRGFMQAVDFSFHTLRGREGLIAVLAEQDLLIHLVISHLLHVHGIRVAPTFTGRSVMRIEPPLIATADQCSAFVQALDATLACVAAGDTASLLAPVAGYRGDELRSLVKSSCASRLTQPSANTPPAHQPNSVKEPAASAGSTRFGFIIHMASLDDLVRFDKSLAIFSDKDLSRIKSQLLNDAEPLVIGETSVTSQTGAGLVGCFVLVPFTPAELTGMKRAEALELIQQAVDLAAAENVEVIGLGGFSSILSGGGIALERSKLPPITSGNAFTAASILRAVNARAQLRQLCLHDATAAVVGATGQIGRVVSLLLAEQYGRLVLVGSERDSAQRRLRAVAEAVVLHALAPQDSVIQGNTTPGDCRDSFAAYVRRIATSARSASLDDFGHIVDLMIEDGRLTLANSAHMDLTSVDVLVTSTSATAPFIDATPLKSGVIICDASRPMNVIRDTLDTRPDIEWIEGGVIQVPGQPDLPMYAGPTHNRVFACVAETMLLALEPELRTLDVPEHIDPCTVNHLDAAARRHGLEVIT